MGSLLTLRDHDGTRHRQNRRRSLRPGQHLPQRGLIGQDGRVTDRTERPWGAYTVLTEGADFKVKTIEVSPGQRLSYQVHARRSEHWFVVLGAGTVTLDGDLTGVQRGDTIDVPVGTAHRIHNTGDVPLVFVEVQHGDYFGEDDIVRLDDDYGRSAPEHSEGQRA
jgi:mannose-6-phosphate isomerase